MPLCFCVRRVALSAIIAAVSLLPLPGARAQTPASRPASGSDMLKMPVRGGAISLKVPDFVAARQQVMDASAKIGAEIVGGKTFVTEKGRKHGYIHICLPTDRLPELLPSIRAAGTLTADNLSTTDQVSGYEDLGRRIERLRKHQSRLDELLHSRRNLRGSDILYVQERLFRAGVDEEQLLQERLDRERQSQTAQITVTLFEPLPVVKPATPIVAAQNSFAHWFDNGKRRAEWRRDQLVARIATGAAFALVYTPVWLPLALITLFLLRAIWQRRAALVRGTCTVLRYYDSIVRAARRPAVTTPSSPEATSS